MLMGFFKTLVLLLTHLIARLSLLDQGLGLQKVFGVLKSFQMEEGCQPGLLMTLRSLRPFGQLELAKKDLPAH